jgi:hypothetical protein
LLFEELDLEAGWAVIDLGGKLDTPITYSWQSEKGAKETICHMRFGFSCARATRVARRRDYLLRLKKRSEDVIQSSTKETFFLLCSLSLPVLCFSLSC